MSIVGAQIDLIAHIEQMEAFTNQVTVFCP